MKKQILSLAAVCAFTLAVSSCGDSTTENKMEDSTAMMADQPMDEDGVMVGGAMMVPSKNIVENAQNSNDHTTLVAAVGAAGLAEILSGGGPYTVFAPTNAAFQALPEGTLDDLMKPENKDKLSKILTYHVVPGAYKAAGLQDGMMLKTVEGKELKVTVKDGMVMVDGANVTTADAVSSNGVTHVIDKVLMP